MGARETDFLSVKSEALLADTRILAPFDGDLFVAKGGVWIPICPRVDSARPLVFATPGRRIDVAEFGTW